MNDIIADFLGVAVEVVLTAAMISGIVLVLATSSGMQAELDKQQALSADMREYRKYNQYDHTVIHSQDIVSLIFQTKGNPTVGVKTVDGVMYAWTAESRPCEYTSAEVTALVDPTVMYESSIVRGGNGEVMGYEFKAVTSGGGVSKP